MLEHFIDAEQSAKKTHLKYIKTLTKNLEDIIDNIVSNYAHFLYTEMKNAAAM